MKCTVEPKMAEVMTTTSTSIFTIRNSEKIARERKTKVSFFHYGLSIILTFLVLAYLFSIILLLLFLNGDDIVRKLGWPTV